MYKSLPSGTLTYPITAACVIITAALSVLWAPSGHAAQISAQFDVDITLQTGSAIPNIDLCRSSTQIGAFGNAVTVICSSGEIVDFSGDTSGLPWSTTEAGAYRFVSLTPSSAEPLGTVQSYPGLGPISSWRKVKLADRNYLELTISW